MGHSGVRTLDDGLETLLSDHGRVIVAALADDGFRTALPAEFPVGDHQVLSVPATRATMLDVVVPIDRMPVVTLWERARAHGIGTGAVHLLTDPDRRMRLTIIDARHSHGIWCAVLTDDDAAAAEAATPVLADSLNVPARPRQATAHKSMTAIMTAVDANFTGMFGLPADSALGLRSTELIHPDDRERAVASWMELLSTGAPQRIRLRHRCHDGTWRWVEVEHVHNGAEDPDDIDVVANISDISDEMAAYEAVRRREQLFSRLAESLPTGVLQFRQDGTVVYGNARLGGILGIGAARTATDVLDTIVEADRAAVRAALQGAFVRGDDAALEVEVQRPAGGERRRCALTIAAVDAEDGAPGALLCVDDVTDSARLREELRIGATVDALTGCLNRSAVMQALDGFLLPAGVSGATVLFVDVDNFKPVNDRLGHAAGDELLVHVAERLRALTRDDDVVGRLGGDEFLLVCGGLRSRAQAEGIAARVRDALNGPVSLSAGTVDLRVSIGVAGAAPGATCDGVVAHADTAMYESKRQGRGAPVFA